MATLILDAGNSIIKATSKDGKERQFPHAIRELSEVEYSRIIKRAGPTGPGPDYLRINGVPYVVGQSAERHGVVTRHTGAARYTPHYYGALAAAMLGRTFERSADVAIFGSHAPGDVDYRDDLMDAVIGRWELETDGTAKTMNVTYANAYDEGLGGWANVVLSSSGKEYARTDVNNGYALIIDVGGGTTDLIGIAPGGIIDNSLQISFNIGILDALQDFEQHLLGNNRDAFKAGRTRPERIREALRDGEYNGGGRVIDCRMEADQAVSVLLNRIAEAYQQRAGGATAWDTIILTGGGIGVIHERLCPLLGHNNIVFAEALPSIHLANVRGGLKLYRLFETEGWL